MSDDEHVQNFEGSVDDFQAMLSEAGDKLVVVDFFAEWCGPCRMIAPKVHAMAEEMENVKFVKVDVDENEDVTESADVQAMPTFILYKKGEKVDTMSGANADKLKEMIKNNESS
jgi:thioredoxin 1